MLRECALNDEVSEEYSAAIGSVMDARKRYEEACSTQGADSWAAQQAHDYLTREIDHRNEMRARYDATADERTER